MSCAAKRWIKIFLLRLAIFAVTYGIVCGNKHEIKDSINRAFYLREEQCGYSITEVE